MSPALQPVFVYRNGTRADANIHKFACKYLQIKSARLSSNGTMVTFASDASLLRHTSTVAAECSGFCARSWVTWRKLQRSLANTGLFLSTGNRYLFLHQRQ